MRITVKSLIILLVLKQKLLTQSHFTSRRQINATLIYYSFKKVSLERILIYVRKKYRRYNNSFPASIVLVVFLFHSRQKQQSWASFHKEPFTLSFSISGTKMNNGFWMIKGGGTVWTLWTLQSTIGYYSPADIFYIPTPSGGGRYICVWQYGSQFEWSFRRCLEIISIIDILLMVRLLWYSRYT